jgi:uncharacterized protein GlcG (DUF336 family)
MKNPDKKRSPRFRRSMNMTSLLPALIVFFLMGTVAASGQTAQCDEVPNRDKLRAALVAAVSEGDKGNGGLGNQEWASVVNRDGVVCAVTFSGPDRNAEWPGSRLISAEKANTANAFSGPNFALSTANIYAAAQPGGSLYGIVTAAPPNPTAAFAGKPDDFGQTSDPLVGKPVGGVIIFAGGVPLYTRQGKLVGGLGVSGDTACADHVIAWKVRNALSLDGVPMGVGTDQTDNILFDIQNGISASGFGHPTCKGGRPSEDIAKKLTQSHPVRRK